MTSASCIEVRYLFQLNFNFLLIAGDSDDGLNGQMSATHVGDKDQISSSSFDPNPILATESIWEESQWMRVHFLIRFLKYK